jgi:hypothetical protein
VKQLLLWRMPSCPALCRASTFLATLCKKGVDGRVEPGHDAKRLIFKLLGKAR